VRKAIAIGLVVTAIIVAMVVILLRQRAPTTDPIARTREIEPEVASARGLVLKQSIPAQLQTTADFRAYMDRAASKETAKLRAATTALVALGLLPTTLDLGRAVADTMVTQAAAYYDPETKRFSIVQLPEPGTNRDLVVAHELTHGLQDQHFDLTTFLDGNDLDSDALFARRFVVEGDAMWTSIVFSIYAATKTSEITSAQIDAMRPQLEKFATSDLSAMVGALQQQTASITDPAIRTSIDSMGTLPRIVLVPMLASYMHGSLFVLEVYAKGGWEAVNRLFTDPPLSTEQVLHADRWFAGDGPVRVTLPTIADSELVISDVLGELQWSVYFSLWPHTSGANPERDWGGDRYAVWRDKDSEDLTVLIATTWDTPLAAKTFHDAYVSTLAARFKDREPPLVVSRGQDVFIIDGGDEEQLAAFIEQTAFER
jgi:hypothetical protein